MRDQCYYTDLSDKKSKDEEEQPIVVPIIDKCIMFIENGVERLYDRLIKQVSQKE